MTSGPEPFGYEPSSPLGSVLLPTRSLGVVALVLFVLFATVVAGALWPIQLLEPLWQLKLTAALVNAATFPLLGLALLRLAAFLDPEDPLLERRQRLCSRLAVAAALGFVLLLPLQTAAGLSQSRGINTAQAARIKGAEGKLTLLRQAVASASGNAELNQKLQNLQGPVLGPADLAQPLPLLKAQVRAVLQQAEQQIVRERQQSPPRSPWLLLPDLLRQAVACLALAIGFAALARRPGQSISLLQEWQFRRRQRSEQRTRRRGSAGDDAEYVRQLSGEEEQG
jgi:hypothetical protein